MRAYLIEDLLPADIAKIGQRLKDKGLSGSLDGIYYIPVPQDLLNDEQRAHQAECGPHIFALELMADEDVGLAKLELLVRAQGKLRCSCVAYATTDQRAHVIDWLDTCLRELDISV